MNHLSSFLPRLKNIRRLTLSAATACALTSTLSADSLQWQAKGAHRIAALELPKEGQPGFEPMPSSRTGVTFSNRLTDRQVAENRIRENGSGVALGDIDGDGWTDIYFCRLDGSNVLYRNLGNWKFEDVTESSGIELPNRFSTGAALADLDGDGDLDLIANSIGGGTRIYHNDGMGHFTPDTQSTLFNEYGATSIAIADINNDGDLDFYVSNYRTSTIRDGLEEISAEVKRINGKIVVTPEDRFVGRETPGTGLNIVERGEPDILYVNRGQGVFTPVPWDSGAFLDARRQRINGAPRNWGLSAIFHDLNGDQHPELYVCNDFIFSEDQAYFSRQGRQFQQFSPYSLRTMSLSAMAADAADIDRDGDQDLFVVEMLSRDPRYRQRQRANALTLRAMQTPVDNPAFVPEILRNTLFLNRGDNTFAEIAQFSGLEATEWSWGVVFIDIDLDGWEDVVVTNGNFHDVIDADALNRSKTLGESNSVEAGLKSLKLFPRLETRNLILRNLGNRRFEDRSEAWGFKTASISHGMAHGDLDNDGDLDLVINHLNQEAGLYRNTSPAPRIAVRLKGAQENTRGIGAKIELQSTGLPQSQSMLSGGRYLSSDDSIQVFAAHELHSAKLIVTWRNNRRTIINNPQANHLYEIHESGRTLVPEKKPASSPPLFGLSRITIPSRHREEVFSDFERQPLLSKQYNRLGPSVAWFDFDRDGWDDLIVGSGRGGRLSLLRNEEGQQFSEFAKPPVTQSISRDLGAILGWHRDSQQATILASVSNYEDGTSRGAAVYDYDLSQKTHSDAIAASESTPGPIALADVDQDGDLDLFIGGRIIPGAYPSPADSQIFLNQNGTWQPDSANNGLLQSIGLVSSAIFTDVNGDSAPDLVLAPEWGPVTLLINHAGQFRNETAAWGLADKTGWWNGISSGDFNNDGKIDLVATNWGQNTRYERYRDRPLQIHYGDFNRTGRLVGIESFYDPITQQNKPWIDLDQLALALPEVRRRFPSYRAYADANTEAVIAPYRAQTKTLEVNTLESMLFLNQGDRFESRALPSEAQWAPAFGIGVADFDGDGNHDLALGQNFFQLEATQSRQDAGRGLILLGDGTGQFKVLVGKESGVRLYGEQRSLALADFNHDGRTDIAISESHGPVHLLQNLSPKSGLRVRLQGGKDNPNAIGAQLRLGNDTKLGPVTEIKTATGYWSQDASQVVMTGPTREALWIQWPDGKETTIDVPANQRFLDLTQHSETPDSP